MNTHRRRLLLVLVVPAFLAAGWFVVATDCDRQEAQQRAECLRAEAKLYRDRATELELQAERSLRQVPP